MIKEVSFGKLRIAQSSTGKGGGKKKKKKEVCCFMSPPEGMQLCLHFKLI